jgi:hypothetical protein
VQNPVQFLVRVLVVAETRGSLESGWTIPVKSRPPRAAAATSAGRQRAGGRTAGHAVQRIGVAASGLRLFVLPHSAQNGPDNSNRNSPGPLLAYSIFERENYNDWNKHSHPEVLNESDANALMSA